MRYEEFRREYLAGGLQRATLSDCPVQQFERWMEQALVSGLDDPTAMVLATVDEQGLPGQRIVLLKDVSIRGFVFYTNFSSAKARAMGVQPGVSLLFPWNELDRQVIVGGRAQKLTPAESARYFNSRPRDSQLAAWASRQSETIASRAQLTERFQAVQAKFEGADIPLPKFWGGYLVVPEHIEFWQGGAQRLHDRFRYQRQTGGEWRIERLQP